MFKDLPKKVEIMDVGPRDGLQNEKLVLPTQDKVFYIEKLVEAGLQHIEVTSFVSPRAVPQMQDAAEVYDLLKQKKFAPTVDLCCLIPNEKGFQAALAHGVTSVAFFNATSEQFSKKNVNATVEEVYQRMAPLVQESKKLGLKMRGYVSTVFGCPYEGQIDISKVVEHVQRFKAMGFSEISLGDTIGAANPLQVKNILEALKPILPADELVMHFHDTRGMAVANIVASLEMGITKYDSSSGGLGGCPYAKGATGNVATEDLVYLFHSMGIETGIDIEKLMRASDFVLEKFERQSPSKYFQAIKRMNGERLTC